jgi:hypothetical protein
MTPPEIQKIEQEARLYTNAESQNQNPKGQKYTKSKNTNPYIHPEFGGGKKRTNKRK